MQDFRVDRHGIVWSLEKGGRLSVATYCPDQINRVLQDLGTFDRLGRMADGTIVAAKGERQYAFTVERPPTISFWGLLAANLFPPTISFKLGKFKWDDSKDPRITFGKQGRVYVDGFECAKVLQKIERAEVHPPGLFILTTDGKLHVTFGIPSQAKL